MPILEPSRFERKDCKIWRDQDSVAELFFAQIFGGAYIFCRIFSSRLDQRDCAILVFGGKIYCGQKAKWRRNKKFSVSR